MILIEIIGDERSKLFKVICAESSGKFDFWDKLLTQILDATLLISIPFKKAYIYQTHHISPIGVILAGRICEYNLDKISSNLH